MDLDQVKARVRAWLRRLGEPKEPASRAAPFDAAPQGELPSTLQQAVEALTTLRGPELELDLERAAAIRDTMRAITPEDWAARVARLRVPGTLARHFVPRFGEFPADIATELLGLASTAADGHVREAALRALRRLRRAEALRYVLPRLGDWVPEVREAAAAALGELLERPLAASELLTHYRLVRALRRVGRVDLSREHARITGCLRGLHDGEAVRAAFGSRDIQLRIFVHDLFDEEVCADPARIEALLDARHPALRAWLARRVLDGRIRLRDEQLRALLTSRGTRTVTSILRWLDEGRLAEFQELLLDLSMADAAAVRAAARFRLRARVDLAELAAAARARVDAAKFEDVRPGWIASLCEIDGAASYERILVHLDHPSSRVRAATIHGLALLDAERAVRDTVGFLSDSSGRVRRAVLATLTPSAVRDELPRLRELLRSGAESTQIASLRAVHELSRWEALPELLVGLTSESARVREQTWRLLRSWSLEARRVSWNEPSADERARLAQVWPAVEDVAFVPDWARRPWSYVWNVVRAKLDDSQG